MSRLNLTRGLSLTHIQDASANPSITNTITIQPPVYPEVKPIQEEPEGEVKLKDIEEPDTSVEAVDEIEYLKSIIRIYMAQKFTYEGKQIVCTSEELSNLIKALTGGEVSIETGDIDIECGCCSSKEIPLKAVSKIWIVKDDVQTVFRYSYPQFLYLFDQYNISLKFIHT